MKTQFYYCPVCGNVILKHADSGVIPHCCGREMWGLKPNTMDASTEKHVPVITRVDDCTLRVEVGSQPHPMTQEHFIRFVFLETEKGGQVRYFKPDEPAVALFCTCKDKPVAAYEYCNLHGLWLNDAIPEKKETDKPCCGTKCDK